MSEYAHASQNEELPEVSASLVLIRTGAEAVIRALGRKRGEKFLREWMNLLATEESVALLLPIRPTANRAEQSKAGREASAWLRAAAPTLIASLPPE